MKISIFGKSKLDPKINKKAYTDAKNEETEHKFFVPPGHFYSPMVSNSEIIEKQEQIWKGRLTNGIKDIDLNVEEQLSLLKAFSGFYPDMPFTEEKKEGLRYSFNNDFFGQTDAIILYSMMRYFEPKNIIEVGSGFSSAVMLDTKSLFLSKALNLTFIEPYPERLLGLLSEEDKLTSKILVNKVQETDISLYKELKENDILFIDSSHVSKTGSDINHIFFNILPVLNSGVIIHFHDIHYPFEYHKNWVFEGRNWNEAYLLRAFMMNNNKYQIKMYNDYLHIFHKTAFSEIPLCYRNPGGSFWMKKL